MTPTPVKPPDERIPADSWAKTPPEVQRVVQALAEEVRRLREAGRRTSRNSSQPPSQDSVAAKAQQAKVRTERRSGRQRGGQVGHPGKTRELLPVELVDNIVICKPSVCVECGSLLLGEDSQPQRHQVTDLPSVRARVTEYQVHCVTCLHCQNVNVEPLPAEVGAGQFGPNLVSALVMLMGRYRLSKRQVVDWLENFYDASICPSSVVNLQNIVSEALAEPVAALQQYVQTQPACNIDETSWTQANLPKRAWLWAVVTPWASVFEIALSRGGEVARRLLQDFTGIVGSDRHSGYNWLLPTCRQVCWSHLLRDFQKILERDTDSYPIGYHLQLQADYLLALWAKVRTAELPRAAFDIELPALQAQVHHWLTAGADGPSPKTVETCRNLLTLWDALWSFTRHPGVEPTNNSAERALRHPVIWRRLSYGTHSSRGSTFVARILSVVETCRLQQRSPLLFIRQALIAFRSRSPAPSLLPVLPIIKT
jgi:transposase